MNYQQVEKFLLPARYRKWGVILSIAGVPLLLLFLTAIVFSLEVDRSDFASYWDEYGLFLLHIPISLGFFWILFSREKEEDEMFLLLRLKAAFHAIRAIFIAILFLPAFTWAFTLLKGEDFSLPDIGGNLAVVSLILLYANAAYWYFKRDLKE